VRDVADDYVKYKELVEEDKICFISGVVERKTDEPMLQVTRVVSVEQGQLERTTGLVLLMDLTDNEASDLRMLESIKNVLGRSRGNLPVFLHIRDGLGKWLRMKAGSDLSVNPTTLNKADLETILVPVASSSRARAMAWRAHVRIANCRSGSQDMLTCNGLRFLSDEDEADGDRPLRTFTVLPNLPPNFKVCKS